MEITMLKKILLSTLILTACTANQEPALEDALTDVEFRNAPKVLYLSQYEFNAGAENFAKIATACKGFGDPKVAVTFTEYPPNVTGSSEQVIGLGFSAVAPKEVVDCYRDVMLKLGAHP
jgi:hypothetical protein